MAKKKTQPAVALSTLPVPTDLTPRTLSKSRFKVGAECPTKLFYLGKPEYPETKSTDSFLKALAEGGHQVGALAKLHFPGGVEIEEKDPVKAIAATRIALAAKTVTLFEAAFSYQNFLVRVDVLEKDGDNFRLHEVKASTYEKEEDNNFLNKANDAIPEAWREYIWDLAFQKFVVQKVFEKATIVPYLMLLDKATRTSVDGLGNKFLLKKEKNDRVSVVIHASLTPETMGAKILKSVDATDAVNLVLAGKDKNRWRGPHPYADWISQLSAAYSSNTKLAPTIGNQCKSCEYRIDPKDYPGKISAFDSCWKEALSLKESDLERPRTFDVWDFRRTDALIAEEGKYFLDELTKEHLPFEGDDEPILSRTGRQWLQIQKHVKKDSTPEFKKEEFLEEIKNLKGPHHFIDFETSRPPIPFTKNRRPYEQIAFQYSHHVMLEDGTIEHRGQFIEVSPGTFPNFEFVRSLKKELETDNGPIFCYSHHENTVLRDILFQFENATPQEAPDKDSLIAWLKAIVMPEGAREKIKRGQPLPWTPTRPMVDMLELVKKYYYHPLMKNSNSIKVVLPAVLQSSKHLQQKYSKAIYGAKGGIKSHNYQDKAWIQKRADNSISDPYELLEPIFRDYGMEEVNRLFFGEELDDGGAATVAYCRLQFTEMSAPEREHLTKALLRYCELDTLAMVMLFEYWKGTQKQG